MEISKAVATRVDLHKGILVEFAKRIRIAFTSASACKCTLDLSVVQSPLGKVVKFTKREKIVAVLIGILTILVFIIPQDVLVEYELLGLVFVILPIGILIVTDPERR